MNRVVAWVSILLALSMNLRAQDKSQVFPLNLHDVPFSEFAGLLRVEFGIYIYYKPEWVAAIRISATSDSVNIRKLLDEAFRPAGINYLYRGNGQYFVTGTRRITDPGKVNMAGAKITKPDSSRPSVRQAYFGQNSYEQTVKKVITGNKDKNQGIPPMLPFRKDFEPC